MLKGFKISHNGDARECEQFGDGPLARPPSLIGKLENFQLLPASIGRPPLTYILDPLPPCNTKRRVNPQFTVVSDEGKSSS